MQNLSNEYMLLFTPELMAQKPPVLPVHELTNIMPTKESCRFVLLANTKALTPLLHKSVYAIV